MKWTWVIAIVAVLVIPGLAGAQGVSPKKGLMIHNSIYGSTIEAAYWIKAIIGHENQLDVKAVNQVITIEPYDYIIMGSVTRNEGPTKPFYEFIDKFSDEIKKKQVCYFLTCGDTDETMVLKAPGIPIHPVGGRNYLWEPMDKYPDIKPVVIGGFGGRQVMPSMGSMDSLQIWMVGKLAKEGAPWEGLDIWESLVVERVELFANEVRTKILGLEPRENIEQFRGYWQSAQPGSLKDAGKKKFKPKPYTEVIDVDKMYYSRSRITGDLDLGVNMVSQWAKAEGITLEEKKKTAYNVWYIAKKTYGSEELSTHMIVAVLSEDPSNVHFSFRCFDKTAKRGPMVEDIKKAEKILWADGRKIE
ncbi:MAG: hypothetical protein GY868_03870 [Deltaproteobacteria bacterium]|nr:hypothetical protein [Deltaproteobacteria bacterium]